MKIILFFLVFIFHTQAFAFVLLNPKYSLKDATKAQVKLSAEGCTAEGISDDEMVASINWAIDFWNDVPESRLKLSYGGRSTATLSDSRIPENEIIVGCDDDLPSVNILGATEHDRANGSARVTMNSNVYNTGSGYRKASFIGTMGHEIGHGVGLYHSNDPASIMTYANHAWVDLPTYISQDDVDGVVYLYPNESAVGGLLGSCSSFASDSQTPTHYPLDLLIGFLGVLMISGFVRWTLKFFITR